LCDQGFLKRFKGALTGGVVRNGVPQPDSALVVTMDVWLGGTERYSNVVGTPGAWVWDDNFRLGDGDYLVLDLKNYYDTSSSSTFSQSGPFYQLDHVCHRLPVI